MENNKINFALQLYKTQLQETLTVIGKSILKEVDETLDYLTEDEKIDKIKDLMSNPFDEVARMCEILNFEYQEFRNSPEVKKELEELVREIKNNPDAIDTLLNEGVDEIREIIKNKKDNDGNLQ